jgi:hypothetical protein
MFDPPSFLPSFIHIISIPGQNDKIQTIIRYIVYPPTATAPTTSSLSLSSYYHQKNYIQPSHPRDMCFF